MQLWCRPSSQLGVAPLQDSTTDFAAQNKGGRDEGTPGQTDASARPGANTPKGQNELQNPNTPTLPNALGGMLPQPCQHYPFGLFVTLILE